MHAHKQMIYFVLQWQPDLYCFESFSSYYNNRRCLYLMLVIICIYQFTSPFETVLDIFINKSVFFLNCVLNCT